MCNFFSCVSDGHGSIRYFGSKERTEIEKLGNPEDYKFDSHSSICHYFGINEDKWNKYEYNPFTKIFVVDQLNNKDDSAHVEKQVRDMDFNPIFETGLFDIDLSSLESLDDITLPEKYKLIYLGSIKKLENFTFPEECNNIDLESCTELNNIKLPEKCHIINLYCCTELNNVVLPKKMTGFLDLSSLKSLENFVFPEECNNINLESCTELNNVKFPKECKYINLYSCTELNNVTFPKIITGYLDLSSLKSLDNVILPEKCNIIYLRSINSWEFELPKKHGSTHFKDKTVYSNL